MKKLLHILLLLSCILSYTAVQSQNWGEQILRQPNTGVGYTFGNCVAIDGNYAIVGAPGENDRTGSAHIYKRDANGDWNYLQKIEAYVGKEADEYFGTAVAIQGDYIFVTSATDRLNEAQFQNPAGSVMIYKRDANDIWTGIQRLRSSDISTGDYFGSSIAVDGDYIVIGANQEDHDVNGNNGIASSGSAYAFKKDVNGVWNETQKLVPSHRANSDQTGKAVSISGDYIVLSSRSKTDVNDLNSLTGNGAAFVFKKNANGVWNETQKLKASDNVAYTNFGNSGIAIDGDYIAIGATGAKDSNGIERGAVFMFKIDANGTWNEIQKIVSTNPNEGDIDLGQSIVLDGDLLIATAPSNDFIDNGVRTSNTGGAFLFLKDANDIWTQTAEIFTSEPELNAKVGGGQSGYSSSSFLAVGLSGNYFILGAQQKDVNAFGDAGSAYISGDINVLGLLTVLSIDKNNIVTDIKAYPNPITEKLFINLNNTYNSINLEVINILGKTIIKHQYTKTNTIEVQFKNLAKGIYMVKLIADGKKSGILKILKK